MPGVFTHTLLANRTLERWRAEGSALFDSADPRCRAAFIHGALGPDLGYFPETDRFLSELMHRLRTGRMTARLFARARGDLQIAFACGWATHLLGDAAIHPLVDQEAARIASSADERGLHREAVDLAHIRIEVGLDGVLLAAHPEIGQRLPVVFGVRDLSFIAGALSDVYGVHVSGESLHAAHQSIAQWHRCLVPLVRWMTADWSATRTGAGQLVAPLLRAKDGGWVRYIGAGPVAAAFISPLRPSAFFCAQIEKELHALDAFIDDAVQHPWALADVDMEDGALIHEQMPKPRTIETMRELERRTRVAHGKQQPYSDTLRKPTMNATVMSAIRSMP